MILFAKRGQVSREAATMLTSQETTRMFSTNRKVGNEVITNMIKRNSGVIHIKIYLKIWLFFKASLLKNVSS